MGRNRDEWRTPARVTASVSVVVAIVLAATSIVAADDHGTLVALLGVGAVVALTVALVAEAPIVVWVAVVMPRAAVVRGRSVRGRGGCLLVVRGAVRARRGPGGAS